MHEQLSLVGTVFPAEPAAAKRAAPATASTAATTEFAPVTTPTFSSATSIPATDAILCGQR